MKANPGQFVTLSWFPLRRKPIPASNNGCGNGAIIVYGVQLYAGYKCGLDEGTELALFPVLAFRVQRCYQMISSLLLL
jgi:hypothetical protein